MSKATLFLKRLKKFSLKRFFGNVDAVHREFGTPKLFLLVDMVWQAVFGGVGYLEYYIFGFARIGRKKRKTFIRMCDSVEMTRRLNQAEHYDDFNDKLRFDRAYGDLLKREFCDISPDKEAFAQAVGEIKEFETFVAKHPVFFAKQPLSYGGLGVKKFDSANYASLEELKNELLERKMFLLEESIIQCPEMILLSEKSVNTIRITTLLSDNKVPHVMYCILRIGNGKNDVDNISSGGMYTLLSSDGQIVYPAFCDFTLEYYEKHPFTSMELKGFKVPYFEESLELCRQAALRATGIRYIGWDVAITENGPCLVEGNPMPGYDMPQNHRFRDNGEGMKEDFYRAEKDI